MLLRIFASCESDYKEDVAEYFEETSEQFSNGKHSYTIGTITLRNYIKLYNDKPVSLIVVDTLSESEYESVNIAELVESLS